MTTQPIHNKEYDYLNEIVILRSPKEEKNSTEIIRESRSFLDGYSYGNILKIELIYAIIELQVCIR